MPLVRVRQVARTAGVVLAVLALLAVAAFPAGAQEPEEAPAVTADGAVLWDALDDRVLYGKQETVARPMASVTKIMTVLLGLEAGLADETVTVSAQAEATGQVAGAATLRLRAGQRLPGASLLAGLLLRSGNDAAVAVAEHVAGSEAAFTDKMNARAGELGLDDTTFVNASGLTGDPVHAASPLDLAILAETAMDRPAFAEWAGSAAMTVDGLGSMVNRNELLGSFPGATGVKTGFTRLAGLCLVASATRDGGTLYAVVLGSDAANFDQHFVDAAALLDYGFARFRRVDPIASADGGLRYRWADGAVPLRPAEPPGATVPVDADVFWRVRLTPDLARPAPPGTAAGEAVLRVDGEPLRRVRLETVHAAVGETPATAAGAVGAAIQDAIRTFVRLQPVDRAA